MPRSARTSHRPPTGEERVGDSKDNRADEQRDDADCDETADDTGGRSLEGGAADRNLALKTAFRSALAAIGTATGSCSGFDGRRPREYRVQREHESQRRSLQLGTGRRII